MSERIKEKLIFGIQMKIIKSKDCMHHAKNICKLS